MKVTTETINGKLYNVVWHSDRPYEPKYSNWYEVAHGVMEYIYFPDINIINESEHIATALPALPLYPKVEDTDLFYRYMSEGLEPVLKFRQAQEWGFEEFIRDVYQGLTGYYHIIHCLDDKGDRIDIAIEDK